MGVMSCDRAGCNNIMCDFYSDKWGYLCYTCIEELQESNPVNEDDIDVFMNGKRINKHECLNIYEIFELRKSEEEE